MTNTYRPRSNDLDHISERLRRMETRLCKLMVHMGLDPMGEESVTPPVPTMPRDYAAPEDRGIIRPRSPEGALAKLRAALR